MGTGKEINVKLESGYDPTIQALLLQAENDWGDPLINRDLLVRYGIKPLDMALYGIDTTDGELNLVLGPEKRRKTTFMVNVLTNIFLAELPRTKPFIVVESLESGMPPNKYRDTIIANLASRLLLAQGHMPREYCPVCNDSTCKELTITTNFLKYNTRSVVQMKAIKDAMDIMRDWSLLIYGAPPSQGETRNLQKAKQRWKKLRDDIGFQILISDHLQQYSLGFNVEDYEKQLKVVAVSGDFVAEEKVAMFLISQVSLTSQRLAKEGLGRWGATGGQKGAQEANTVFATDYENNSGEMSISILDSRKTAQITVYQAMEDNSGAYYGQAFKKDSV